jgi:hypothetical protein
MRFYTQQHKFYCGIDPHTKNMFFCILDAGGNVRIHQNIHTNPEALLSAVPFRTGLNLNKGLVQDLLLHPIRNQAGTTANGQKSLFLLERKSITFSSWISFPY